MNLLPSRLDSARFGLRIGRLDLDGDSDRLGEIATAFLASRLDILIVRYSAAMVDGFARMLHEEFSVIHADTLVCFGGAASLFTSIDDSPVLRLAGDTVIEARLADAVRSIFGGYRNHYAANPAVDSSRVVEGYVEWAEAHRTQSPTSVIALEDPGAGELAAVAAITTSSSQIEVDLAGVAPSYRRMGIYQRLLDAVSGQALRRNINRIVISTQSHNLAAQRAWARRGWVPEATYQTVHLCRH